MFSTGHIVPCWNIDEFKNLNYKADIHKDIELIDAYEKSGHYRPSMSLHNYFQPNPFPEVVWDYIVPNFSNLENIGVAINYFKPGQYLPVHVDLFEKYSHIHGIENEEIVRVIIRLEDSKPGQISQVCDQTIGKWNAGDWFQWDAKDPHAFYNFSMQDRYAIQLTGTKIQKNLF